MNYGIYKNARNASWQCLIDCGISELPVKPTKIAMHYDIECRYGNKILKANESGKIVRMYNEQVVIIIDKNQPVQRQRFTIMHELGHYLLKHLGDIPFSRSEQECKPDEEYVADRFAADMLMPACVLWALNIHTPEEIARLCNVSMQAAQIRAERMDVLYKRNKFLTHPIERRVYQQFSDFIQKYNQNNI